ncbi:MAG: helicase HerA-like domain-containing protein [Mangrovibacterium sp.]
MQTEQFLTTLEKSYSFSGESILIGSSVLGEVYSPNIQVRLPLKTFNRHGLIAGATGTGKTKSLQVFAEELSNAGVPVLVMDIKGDLSGLGATGTSNPVIEKRSGIMNLGWKPQAFPLEFLSISEEPGARMRATVSEYGPILLSKILELNDNQASILSMIFKYCDDRQLPLLDFKDLKSVIAHIQDEGKDDFVREYGLVQTNSAGVILRSIIALEQQKADEIFGEPSFDISDLMRKSADGKGMINVLRLTDMQTKPALFSTFMLCLLAEVFEKMPELGDPQKPELVMFIDEAHLIFKNASKSLLDQFEMTIKLIRSKGVGIFFVTQSPADIPAAILGQLGTKVQHALRAFTAKDRKDIVSASENYPYSEFYKVSELIMNLGTGEALVTTLDEKGRPTELVHTMMKPPFSRMDVLTDAEIKQVLNSSQLINKYNVDFDRKSAYEILQNKLSRYTDGKPENEDYGKLQQAPKASPAPSSRTKEAPSTFEQILKSPVTKSIVTEVTRGLLGVLGLRSTSTRKRR